MYVHTFALSLMCDYHIRASSGGQFMKNILDNHTSRIRELSLKGLLSSTLLHDAQPSFRLRSLQLVGHGNASFPISIIANSEDLLDLDIAWCSVPLTGLTSLKMVSNPTRPLLLLYHGAWGHALFSNARDAQFTRFVVELCRRTSNPLRLTKLRRLDLSPSRNTKEVLNVLSYIVVPQVASIKIHGGIKTPQNISDFASSLSAFISEMTSEDNHAMFYQELNTFLLMASSD